MKIRPYLVFLFLSAFFVFFSPCQPCLAQEQVTITTYYPAPYGVYRDMRANQIAVGSTYRTVGLSDGEMRVSGALSVNPGGGAAGPGLTPHGGKFEVNIGANNNYFQVNNDNSVGLELRSGTTGGTPYVDFSNDAGSDYDYRFFLRSDGGMEARGQNPMRFTNLAGAPSVVYVREVWHCSSYP